MMDDPNTKPEANDTQQQQHDDANQLMRLGAIEKRIDVAETKLQQALAMAAHLTPRGPRYEQ
jgi:hypothetical protein